MPEGQRGPLSTRGTAVRRWRGSFVKSFYDVFGISGDPSVSAVALPALTERSPLSLRDISPFYGESPLSGEPYFSLSFCFSRYFLLSAFSIL